MTIDTHLQHNLINGDWLPSETGRTFDNVNPANTADVIGAFADSSAEDARAAVSAAEAAGPAWDALGSITRGEILFRAAELMADRKAELGEAVSREQGKLLAEGLGEAQRAIDIVRHIAGAGRRISGSTLPADEDQTIALTWRVPIGVVSLITPWNFPLAIPAWKVAPALLAGCTAILKPSPLAPLSSAILVDIFQAAGVPAGVLNLVQGDRDPGEVLSGDERVRGISFTGSLPVGLAIQQAAVPRLARTQLELGGKNALIVLADADLDRAADAIVLGAFGQAGQRCSATSRVVVDRAVREPLIERLLHRVGALRLGDPAAAGTTLGPVVNEARLNACVEAVGRATGDGATIRTGGARSSAAEHAHGWFVEPTILTDVAWDSELATEEIFGPVLAVIDADGYEDAMRIANSVKYGMSGTIFTSSMPLAHRALREFQAGMLHVNRPGVGAWPHMPHMGAKLSQYGSPECSDETWEFYTEWRSACINLAG